MKKTARYVRVSTKEQNPARQLPEKPVDEKIYLDKVSGTLALDERPQGKQLIADVEAGKIGRVIFESVDRLGRSTSNVINMLEYFLNKGVIVKIDNLDGMESVLPNGKPNDMFKLVTTILANLSEMEKTRMLERQAAGIKAAKERDGVYLGRTKGSVEPVEVFLEKHKTVVKALKKYPSMSLRELAKQAKDGKYEPSANTVKKVKEILDKQKDSR